MRVLLTIAILLATPALGQNAIYVYPPTPRIPVGGIQSITAVVNGNANKSVKWSTSCGQLVGSGNTIGLKSSATGTCVVTATMAGDGTKTATSKVTFEDLRKDLQAANIHPRIGLTPEDVADLRSKTVSRNVAWSGISAIFASRRSQYDAHFCWSGGTCGAVGPIGTLGPNGWVDAYVDRLEEDTALYAVMSLIDPNTSSRATWASHAHDLSMWEMNEICYNAASGSGPCVPRIYPGQGTQGQFTPWIGAFFVLANRPQTNFLPQMEAIDWNYSSFTADDKATIAKVLHVWGQQLTGANDNDSVSGGGEHPKPVGTYSDPILFNANVGVEQQGLNNYAMGHFLATTTIGLLLDPADDPVVASCAPSNTTICPKDGSAKTVGAYGVSAVKAWLYRNYAALEDQHIVNYAYGISDPNLCPDIANPQLNSRTIPCTGSQSGGFPAEGTEYGALSMSDFFPALYTLYLDGKLNPATDPQASLISSSFWDKMAISMVHQLYPSIPTNAAASYTQFGDDQSYAVVIQQGLLFNALEVYDAKFGSTWRKNLDKWYQYNALFFGQSGYAFRWLGTAGTNYQGGNLYPLGIMQATSTNNDGDFSGANAPNPTPNQYDPRNAANLPLDMENISSPGGFYRYYGRSDWSTSATQFQFGCNTAVQDHAFSPCGRFDYLRNGEPLVTALGGNFGSAPAASSPNNQNIPGYQWNPSFACSPYASVWFLNCVQGGAMPGGEGAFSNTMLATSSNSTYYYGATDASGAYLVNYNNCVWCSATANVNLSQREVLWLKPDLIWVYDRAETASGSSFKTWNIDTQTMPAISGNLATITSNAGQKLYVTSLLPGTSSYTTAAQTAPSAPVTALLTDTASSNNSVRMLHTLEGRNSGAASSTNLVQSSAGTSFDGGVIGSTIALFKRNLADTFTSVTYPASGATTHYIAGLVPNTPYSITGTGTPPSATTDSAGLLTFTATGTGNITVKANGAVATLNERTSLLARIMKWGNDIWDPHRTGWQFLLAAGAFLLCLLVARHWRKKGLRVLNPLRLTKV